MNIQVIEDNKQLVVNLLKALSNEKRLEIICALYGGEKKVGELEKHIDLSQSALSQHLSRLRRDNIVDTRREAQTIYYSLKDSAVQTILGTLQEIFENIDEHCD